MKGIIIVDECHQVITKCPTKWLGTVSGRWSSNKPNNCAQPRSASERLAETVAKRSGQYNGQIVMITSRLHEEDKPNEH